MTQIFEPSIDSSMMWDNKLYKGVYLCFGNKKMKKAKWIVSKELFGIKINW